MRGSGVDIVEGLERGGGDDGVEEMLEGVKELSMVTVRFADEWRNCRRQRYGSSVTAEESKSCQRSGKGYKTGILILL